MKFNAKKLLASVMALSMTASLAVPSVFAATDGATETTLPTTHIADLFDGHNVSYDSYDANKIQTWWSEINAATDGTRVTQAYTFANHHDAFVYNSEHAKVNGVMKYDRLKGYYIDGNTFSGYYPDEMHEQWVRVEPYKYINSSDGKGGSLQKGRAIAGVGTHLMYTSPTTQLHKYSMYDFSKYTDGGYFTLEFKAQGNSNATSEANNEFFDNLYVVCYDGNFDWAGFIQKEDLVSSEYFESKWELSRNYVAVKLSDFAQYAGEGWSAVQVPMTVFSNPSNDYNYYKIGKSNYNKDSVCTPDKIDFSKFCGIGLAWIAPADTSAYTADSEMAKAYDFKLGKISLDQVLAPEITKTEENGKLTLNWDAVNADRTFKTVVYDDETYSVQGDDGTYVKSLRAVAESKEEYRKVLVKEDLTEHVSYSVYKNGKKVADTDETTYTADIGTRNATYYVVAHGERKIDQRRGWKTLTNGFNIKTLTLDSKPSNTVSVGASLDPDKNPRVFDLYVNGSGASYPEGTDLDWTTGSFNTKYNVTGSFGEVNSYRKDNGELNWAQNVFGQSAGYRNNGYHNGGARNETTIDGITYYDQRANIYIAPSYYVTSTLQEHVGSEKLMFDAVMHGMKFSEINTEKKSATIMDLSDHTKTVTIDFELALTNDVLTEQVKKNLYVLVTDGKNATNYLYINENSNPNDGNADLTSNYVLVKLSDFVDLNKLSADTWTTVSVPLSAFSDEKTTYNRKIYTRSSVASDENCTESRPIDFSYFTGAGVVYVSDGNETSDMKAGHVRLDNVSIYNVEAPEVTAAYDAATNTTKLTWDMPNEGYVYYDLYKNGSLLAEDVENGTYTDSTPNVDAVYTVKARHTIDYATVNKYSASTSKQTISTETDKVSIDYADLSINDEGTKVTGTFNPGAEGVWIVIKFDRNFATVGDVRTETITASDNQQVKTADITVADGETVKSFFWSNLTDILPKADAAVYPKN